MQTLIDAPSDGPDNSALPNFILYRELNEVYLLLDHISGRWDKSFSSFETPGATTETGMPSIREICEIRWPNPDDPRKQAAMAEVLLRAKDKLNAAARPASGLTIAFTLMVVGGSDLRHKWPKWLTRSDLHDKGMLSQKEDSAKKDGKPPTRVSLAQEAFPGMIESASQFRTRIKLIVILLLVLLAATCLLSWYTAIMNGMLTHMDAVYAQGRDLENKMALAILNSPAEPEAARAAALTQVAKNTAALSVPPLHTADGLVTFAPSRFSTDFCGRNLLQVKSSGQNKDAISQSDAVQGLQDTQAKALDQNVNIVAMCVGLAANQKEHFAVWENLKHGLIGKFEETTEGRASGEERGRIITQLLVNSVLPFFYGILGAGAAVVRDLWAKTKESLLSPRDSLLALGQLALGAIIGACIGLFVNPTSAGAASGSLLASLALTASALAFVAGFGVEGAFLALESLVRRVFNQTSPGDSRSQPR